MKIKKKKQQEAISRSDLPDSAGMSGTHLP